jgi:hypothetical protein
VPICLKIAGSGSDDTDKQGRVRIVADKIAVVAPDKSNARKLLSPSGPERAAGRASTASSIVQRIQASPGLVSPAEILTLQRTIGNAAVGRLLGRAGEPAATPIQRSAVIGGYGVVVQRDPDDPDQSVDPDQSTDPNASAASSADAAASPTQSTEPSGEPAQSVDPGTGAGPSSDPNAGPTTSSDPAAEPNQSIDPGAGPNQSTDPNPAPAQPTNPDAEPNPPTDTASELGQTYTAAVAAGDWQTAAETLNGFNREDIQSRLAGLGPDQIAKLHQGALDNPRVGPNSTVAQMTASAETAAPNVPTEDSQGLPLTAGIGLSGFPGLVPGTPELPPDMPPSGVGPFPPIPGETPFNLPIPADPVNPGFTPSPPIGLEPGIAPPPGGVPLGIAGGVATAGFLLGLFGPAIVGWAIDHAAETSQRADPDDPNTSEHGVGGAPPQTTAGTDGDAGAPLQVPSAEIPAPALDPASGQPISAPSNQEQAPATDPSTIDPAALPGQPNEGSMQVAGSTDQTTGPTNDAGIQSQGGQPADAAFVPNAPLPNGAAATIDLAKFDRYSMDPNNTGNGGKWKAFQALGYDVQTEGGRTAGAQNVVNQLREKLATTPASLGKSSTFGPRYEVRIEIKGPNGREGTLQTVWQTDVGSSAPRLITNWLEVH